VAFAAPDPNQILPGPASPQPSQAPVAAGGAGAAGAATKQSAATPGVNIPAQPSAQLSAYLGANQQQASEFGGNVANTLSGQTAAAANAIQPAVNTYTGGLYTVPTNEAVNQKVSSAPSTLTPEEKQSFQTELGAAAKVPNVAQTFETTAPYQDLTQNVQKAVEQANLWNSGNNPANLSAALQPFEPAGQSSGNTTLDALLLSQSPGAYSKIQNAVAPAANLQGQLNAGTAQANQSLRDAITQDQAATAAATAAPQTYATNLTAYLKNAVDAATQGNTTQSAKIMADLASNSPTPDDLATLGVSADQWTTLSSQLAGATSAGRPIDLTKYLAQNPSNVTAQNIATPTQYSDVAALQELLGGNAPVVPINATTANDAGTATNPGALNQFDFQGASAAAQTAPLLTRAAALQNEANNARRQYDINHFGGQTPEQFNAYLAGLAKQMEAINNQIAALGSSKAQPFSSSPVPGSPPKRDWWQGNVL